MKAAVYFSHHETDSTAWIQLRAGLAARVLVTHKDLKI